MELMLTDDRKNLLFFLEVIGFCASILSHPEFEFLRGESKRKRLPMYERFHSFPMDDIIDWKYMFNDKGEYIASDSFEMETIELKYQIKLYIQSGLPHEGVHDCYFGYGTKSNTVAYFIYPTRRLPSWHTI